VQQPTQPFTEGALKQSAYLGTAKAKWRQQSRAVSLAATSAGTPGHTAYGCWKPAQQQQQVQPHTIAGTKLRTHFAGLELTPTHPPMQSVVYPKAAWYLRCCTSLHSATHLAAGCEHSPRHGMAHAYLMSRPHRRALPSWCTPWLGHQVCLRAAAHWGHRTQGWAQSHLQQQEQPARLTYCNSILCKRQIKVVTRSRAHGFLLAAVT
jgi:hypothetical protein